VPPSGSSATPTADRACWPASPKPPASPSATPGSPPARTSPPTGPSSFAASKYLFGLNSTYIQPSFGYIINRGRFYIHGFSAFDFPVNTQDVTIMYNDVGMGYYLLRSTEPGAFLSAVAPTFEAHINTPLNHRDPFNKLDIAGTADVVNLTYGVNFEFKRRSILTVAFINPVTSPTPFDFE